MVRTTCPYCGVGCGLVVTEEENNQYSIKGDKDHPANQGRLCSKGSALAETLGLDDRLLSPQIHGQVSDWNSALGLVANKFQQSIEHFGPDSVAFYVSGQLLTEDYYVANKLMKGFIGSANIDTNSRLCMSSSVVGHKRAFGSDTVPGCYEDWDQCNLMILTGSNTAWCHPVLYQRLVLAKKNNPKLKVVVIDPRRTATCDIADLHLPLKPGTDVILFNGLLAWLYQFGHMDNHFVANHTEGLEQAIQSAAWTVPSLQVLAALCELAEDDLLRFFNWYANTEKTITVYSQGVNQSSSGSDKVNAIINCHLLTGRIGKPAMGPFSVTGQPNAMGGREVGALSNQLAAHMDFTHSQDIDRVKRFWQASNMASEPGLKAIDLFKAVRQGQVKALWIMATNPAVSMPNASEVREALKHCDFVVVSDCISNTDTTAYADVLLPALAWGEKSGTVTNSERCISRQRSFLAAPGAAKPDWWILSQVAQRLGFKGFEYHSPAQIFSEHAGLSAFENQGERDFDLSGLMDLDDHEYERLKPTQWPISAKGKSQPRLFDQKQFYTQSGKAQFIALNPRPPAQILNNEYPLVLNTGRIRDQWHTMTRTGKSPRLNGHISEPFLQLHPFDAQSRQIESGQLVSVSSRQGAVILRAELSQDQRIGSVFAPMHWNDQFAANSGIDRIVNEHADPWSGQPEFKHTPVQVKPYSAAWYGFVLSREMIDFKSASYWARNRRAGLWHYELAGLQAAKDWATFARAMLQSAQDGAEWSEMYDSSKKTYRGARFINGLLDSCVFIGTSFQLPPRDWLMQLFGDDRVTRQDRLRVLAGTPGQGQQDAGKIVCSCFCVGRNTLCETIKSDHINTAEQIGEKLQAGTNCGSCIPELKELIAELSA